MASDDAPLGQRIRISPRRHCGIGGLGREVSPVAYGGGREGRALLNLVDKSLNGLRRCAEAQEEFIDVLPVLSHSTNSLYPKSLLSLIDTISLILSRSEGSSTDRLK